LLGCRPFLAAPLLDHGSIPIPSTTTGRSKAKPAVPKSKSSAAKPAAKRRPAEAKLGELKRRLLEISDLGGAGGVLGWDQATYLP
jgi:hypothetical protein